MRMGMGGDRIVNEYRWGEGGGMGDGGVKAENVGGLGLSKGGHAKKGSFPRGGGGRGVGATQSL